MAHDSAGCGSFNGNTIGCISARFTAFLCCCFNGQTSCPCTLPFTGVLNIETDQMRLIGKKPKSALKAGTIVLHVGGHIN